MDYLIHILIFAGIFGILSIGLQIAMGYTGLLNLGHIAFFGIGAYTSAILTKQGISYELSFLLSGIFASIAGVILMYGISKLKGDYLALATLGFGFVVFAVMLNWTSLTRGPLGIPGIVKPEIFGISINSNIEYLIFVFILFAAVYLFSKRLISSRFGRLFEAVRDDEKALQIYGKNTYIIKTYSMGISSFMAGIAGSLYAHYISFIDPTTFYIANIVLVLTIVIVGGLADLEGTVLAVFVIMLIPEALRFLDLPASVIGPLRQIIYALVLILILMYKPRGFYGKIDLK